MKGNVIKKQAQANKSGLGELAGNETLIAKRDRKKDVNANIKKESGNSKPKRNTITISVDKPKTTK